MRKRKPAVTLSKGEEYSPFASDAGFTGFVKRWYAYDETGDAVTWAGTKSECMKDARRMGYAVREK